MISLFQDAILIFLPWIDNWSVMNVISYNVVIGRFNFFE